MRAHEVPATVLARRISGGYTLDEAARMCQAVGGSAGCRCPGCGGELRDLAGHEPHGDIHLLRCMTCGRGLVFDLPAV
jgi:hypothetical protein